MNDPIIEVGELFVVTRGFEYNTDALCLVTITGEDWKPQPEKPKRYDRSYEGKVFRANAVCGCMIAAECVYSSERHFGVKLGDRLSLNTRENEVWPVTTQYLAGLGVQP